MTNDQIRGALELPSPEADLIERVRYLIRLSRCNQQQFAAQAGVEPTVLSKILSGRLKPSESFINRLVLNLKVSKDWLVSGCDVPYPKPEHARTVEGALPSRVMLSAEGAPVYDIDVTAGCSELSRMFTQEHVVGHLNLPFIDPSWKVVKVSGDSMAPRIINGGMLAIRPITNTSIISWGQIYVVVLDDYRMVKYLRRNEDRTMVTLHSANPDYDDIEIPRKDIRALYLVEVVLNCELVG